MEEQRGHKYEISTFFEKLVADYTGLNFHEIEELDYIEYLQYRFDAFISKMNETEKGREYLDRAYNLTQTAPDRKTLRNKFLNKN